jgi:hypothetical protein
LDVLLRNSVRSARAATLAAAVALAASSGCGGGGAPPASSSTAEATVKGTVKLRGKPLTAGRVVFDPGNINRADQMAREAPISKDGTYEIKALVGGNNVRLAGPAVAKDPTLEYQSQAVEVRSGENTIDLEFPAQ